MTRTTSVAASQIKQSRLLYKDQTIYAQTLAKQTRAFRRKTVK